jgi:glycosyltransferase involved in cell wall biosynthesis
MTRVSAIIPNYNHGRFLDQRLRTVLGQTYQDLEVIYLDDASTDDSSAVFAPFSSDRRIRAFTNQVNSGSTFVQWNRGVREARGEYIWIAESDDYADQGLLAALVGQLDRYPQAGIAYCQSWLVDDRGQITGSMNQWTAGLDPTRWTSDFVGEGRHECSRYLVVKNTIPNASAVLFRRALYERIGGADETMRFCGDWKTWVQILLTSDVVFVAQPLNYFRVHAQTVRNTFTRDLLFVEESYRIVAHISHAIPVPADILELVREGLAIRWASALRPGGAALRHSRRILAVARTVDPQIGRRLAQKLAKRCVSGIGRRLKA